MVDVRKGSCVCKADVKEARGREEGGGRGERVEGKRLEEGRVEGKRCKVSRRRREKVENYLSVIYSNRDVRMLLGTLHILA